MSVVTPSTEIDYPESDGRPMGETDWHIAAMIRLRDMLRYRYRGVLDANISKVGNQLGLVDSKTGEEFLTGEESERQAKEVERKGRIAAEAQNERLRSELENLRSQQKNR